jgi:hypothetical protein
MNEASLRPAEANGFLNATCPLVGLRSALQAVRTTASYAPAHSLFLVAEPPAELSVLASCQNMILRSRVTGTEVESRGTAELSFRAVQRLLRQFERSRRAAGMGKRADCPVCLTTDEVTPRSRTVRTLRADLLVPPYAHSCVVDAESLLSPVPHGLLLLLEQRLAADEDGQEATALCQLPAHALSVQLRLSTIAARDGLPVPPALQIDPAPYYGVLLALQPPGESGSGALTPGWAITCTTQGPHQLSLAQARLFPPPVFSGAQPFPTELLLPSWASAELAAHLPSEGEVHLRAGQGWVAFHTPLLDVLADFVEERPGPPPRPGAGAAARVALAAPVLLRALKETTRRLLNEHIGDGGMHPYYRLITLQLDPERGTLDILPEVPGYDAPPIKTSLPIDEGRGTTRRILLASWDLEQALAPLRRSVLLSFYDSEAQFPLVVLPLIPTGYQCWLQARTRQAPPASVNG